MTKFCRICQETQCCIVEVNYIYSTFESSFIFPYILYQIFMKRLRVAPRDWSYILIITADLISFLCTRLWSSRAGWSISTARVCWGTTGRVTNLSWLCSPSPCLSSLHPSWRSEPRCCSSKPSTSWTSLPQALTAGPTHFLSFCSPCAFVYN